MALEQRLQDELRIKLGKREKELAILVEVGRVANLGTPLEKTLQDIIEIALDLLEEKRLVIRAYDEHSQQLILQAHWGMPKGYTEKFKSVSPCQHILKLLETGQPLIIQDISLIEEVGLTEFLIRNGLLSMLCIPLKTKGKIVGIISIYSDELGYYREEEELIYATLANQIAITIENSRLYSNLKQSYLETIKALVTAVEAKDPYTKGHAERVAKYSLAIGQKLKLDKKFLKNLEIAAQLHDIGKIGIPESILAKPTKLDDEEFKIMKSHPIQGKHILEPIKFDLEILDGVYYHHERLDGHGYPFGLKKEEIPLIARILAVADAFDAMTSDRPYRQKMSHNQALDELMQCCGTQFDPQIVDAFRRAFKYFQYTIRKISLN